jgi:hypothetical protein
MKANRLLVSGLLAAAAGTWLAGFVGEIKGQPMTISELRVPFLHGSGAGESTSAMELASLDRANE